MTSSEERLGVSAVLTLGCRLNLYESEVIKAHVAAVGLENVVVVNSCAVTGLAERQARQMIRKARHQNPTALIVVTGCAAHIHPDVFAAMPEVDAVVSNADKLRAEAWESLKKRSSPRANRDPATSVHEACFSSFPLIPVFEGLTRGFVPVQTGCDHACTFCIIPQGRGRARSFAPSRVVEQVRLLTTTCPEIVLTGVDIASYDGEGLRLGGLVKKILAEVPNLERLRLSSLDPAALDEDLWDVIEKDERLMPHLHLSVQAGDDMVLKRMRRRHTRQDVYDLVARARRARSGVVFGADVIAGFPTEDDAMFENTRKMFGDLDFTWLHVFPYSARTGTPAAKMPQVKGEIRKKRAEILRDLGQKAAARHLQGLVGKRLFLHVEGQRLGRAPSFAEVRLDTAPPVGTVVAAKIVGVEEGRAIGQVEE